MPSPGHLFCVPFGLMETYSRMKRTPEAELRGRIESNGPITFAEFMEVALYHPHGGYYTRDRQDPAHRDYYTSPSAHPAFSALIAVHLETMWKALDCPDPFHVVEMGAGSGLMAQDITEYARQHLVALAGAMRYVTVDKTSDEPPQGVVGCVLSNELIDAFPVHRFEIKDGGLVELFVDVDADGRLHSVPGEPSTPALASDSTGSACNCPMAHEARSTFESVSGQGRYPRPSRGDSSSPSTTGTSRKNCTRRNAHVAPFKRTTSTRPAPARTSGSAVRTSPRTSTSPR